MSDSLRILVIEDDQNQRQQLRTILEFLGHEVLLSGAGGWETRINVAPEDCLAVIVGRSARTLDILKQLNRNCPELPILINGTFSRVGLQGSLRRQVVGELEHPLCYSQIIDALHLVQVYRIHCRQGQVLAGHHDAQLFRNLVGNSRAIRHVRALMVQVMEKDVNVLITGESGTGKEVVARNLHEHSSRKDQAFVAVNCGAIAPDLLESELFGHEKGAFTGAYSNRKGRFEVAEGGTLFLDEIGDMPLSMQVKLLRVLQEKTFERVGGSQSIAADVRVIAATHRNLEKMVAEGTFREDLYYRLNVFPIEMPALRQRSEDIPLILNDLINRMERDQRGSVRFSSDTILCLCRYDWQGNVRELANLVERLAIMYPMGVIGLDELPQRFRVAAAEDPQKSEATEVFPTSIQASGMAGLDELAVLPVSGLNLKEFLSDLERKLIRQALDDCNNVVARAADKLQIRRTTLVEKMRKYGLNRYEQTDDSSS